MITRALNKNHDLYVSSSELAKLSDIEEIVQHMKTRLWLFLSEWVLDVNSGVPWFQTIFEKPIDLLEVETIIKREILETEGVNSLLKFDMNYSGLIRSLTITFSVNTTFGDTEESSVSINV